MAKAKPKRKGKQLGLYLPEEMADQLKELSERTMVPQSRLLRRALELLFAEYGSGGRGRRTQGPQ